MGAVRWVQCDGCGAMGAVRWVSMEVVSVVEQYGSLHHLILI
jgi:hypothetical protein